MNELLELFKEAKKSCDCMVERVGDMYRFYAEELQEIQWCIGYIEVEGYRVFVHEGPEFMEDTMFCGLLAEIVHKNEVPEEQRGEYTVICGN